MIDFSKTEVTEETILEKFEGEPLSENLFERLHIKDGEIVKIEKFENGELVSSEKVKEVE